MDRCDTQVDDSDVLGAIDREPRVNDSVVFEREHRRRSDRVVPCYDNRQERVGAHSVRTTDLIQASNSASVLTAGPGSDSASMYWARAGCDATLRKNWADFASKKRSKGDWRYAGSIKGAARG